MTTAEKMEKCFCGSVTVLWREGKQVCYNCYVQKIVSELSSEIRERKLK